MTENEPPSDPWGYLLAAGLGGVAGAAANEFLIAGPRVRVAAEEGFRQGYWTRDAQLQPIMKLQQERAERLESRLLEQEQRLGRIEGAIAALLKVAEALPGDGGTSLRGVVNKLTEEIQIAKRSLPVLPSSKPTH